MRARLVLCLLVASCSGSSTDKTTDTETDSDPLVTDCGVVDETLTADARLLRWPYYTSVTTQGAVIQWGTDAATTSHLTWGTTGELGQDETSTLADIDELVSPIRLNAVTLSGLTPDTTYCYKLRDDAGTDLTGMLRFRTAPPDDTERTVKFIVLGDYGSGLPPQFTVYERIKEHWGDLDFWLTSGDNAYTDGRPIDWQLRVFDVYKELLRRVPYFPTPGNHDYGTGNLDAYMDNFVLPAVALRADDNERYYSFDWGPVHILALDSQVAIDQLTLDVEGDDMMDWARADIAANQDRPWRMAAWHHPAYYGEKGRTVNPNVAAYLRPALEQGDVAFGFSGHSHLYERLNAVIDGETVDEGGTTYITTGGGGAGLDELWGDTAQFIDAVRLRATSNAAFHFMLFEVSRCRVHGQAISLDGTVLDDFERTRC